MLKIPLKGEVCPWKNASPYRMIKAGQFSQKNRKQSIKAQSVSQ